MPISNDRTVFHLDENEKDGHVDVCFDHTGEFVLACASYDLDVRMWKASDATQDLNFSVGKSFAISCLGSHFFVASAENHYVQCHNRTDGEEECTLAKSSAEATCLAVGGDGSDGTVLAAGSADFKVRLVQLEETDGAISSTHTHIFNGHQAPVLSVALDPKGVFLASSSCDGTLKIWNIKTKECVKTLDIIKKSNDFTNSDVLARMAFTPKTGALLAVPFNKEIKLYNREKWEVVGTLSADKSDVSIAAFSPDGSHIAAAYNTGSIVVFDVISRKTVNAFRTPQQRRICGLQWNPVVSDVTLVYADVGGNVGLVESAYSLTAIRAAEEPVGNGVANKSALQPGKTLTRSAFSDDDDSTLDGLLREEGLVLEDGVLIERPLAKAALPVPAGPPRTIPQEPFQPGSTPTKLLEESFMVWNEIGYMKMYKDKDMGLDTDDDDAVIRGIDVIFHSTLHHHTIHVMNAENYTLGTMNSRGYLLATEKPLKQEEETASVKSSKIHFSMVGGSEKDQWTLDLDAGDWAEAIAMGEDWCYVATSKRMLRVITFSGYQQFILDFAGPVVAVAARQKLFMITYHQSDPTLKGDQCIGFSIYRMEQRRIDLIVADQYLPLSPQATLTWLGFGARNTPTTADSAGIVRMYHYRSPLCKIWSPCLEMKVKSENKKDRFFMFALDEDAQQVRAFLCRNSRYPVTLPLPITVFLPFTTLQAGISGDLSKLEAECTLYRLFPQKNDKFLRNCRAKVMRLFGIHCQQGNDNRAKDISQLMPTSKDMEGCWKFANHTGKSHLAEELSMLIAAVAKEDEEDDEDNLLTARPTSPVLFGEGSQAAASPAVDDSPLGQSVQAVKRHVASRPSLSYSGLSTSTNHKSLAGSGWDSDEDDEIKHPPAKTSTKPPVAVSKSISTAKVLTEIDLYEDDGSSRSSMGAEDAPSVKVKPSTSSTAHTMMLADETVSMQPLTPSTNVFKKKEDKIPPILRGISTMEDVTKSRTQVKTIAPTGFITPGIKRKVTTTKPKNASGGPAKKRGRPSAASKGKTDEEETVAVIPPKSAENKPSTGMLEKFGFKKLEKKTARPIEVDGDFEVENIEAPTVEPDELNLSP